MLRPSEILLSLADTTKATRVLQWTAKHNMAAVIDLLLAAESDLQP